MLPDTREVLYQAGTPALLKKSFCSSQATPATSAAASTYSTRLLCSVAASTLLYDFCGSWIIRNRGGLTRKGRTL